MKEIFGMNLTEILKSAVRESVDTALGDEKLKQKKKQDALKDFKAPKDSKKSSENLDVDEGEDEDNSTANSGLKEPVQARESELPEINIETIIDLIGSIRAGQSLKEKAVLSSLKDYFDRLNGNERVALYAFLTGISKVMQNIDNVDKEGSGSQVDTPKNDPFKIQMKKDTPKKDDTPPKGEESPIVVGESANKKMEKLLFKRYSS